jgi:hypothetical protein
MLDLDISIYENDLSMGSACRRQPIKILNIHFAAFLWVILSN